MRQLQEGFSLIHILVYMMCSSLLILVVMQWTSIICLHGKKEQKQNDRSMMACAASDVIARDLRSCVRSVYDSHNSYVWQSGSNFIGWELNKGKLVRSFGEYDISGCVWRSRKKGVIAFHVESFSVSWVANTARFILCVQAPGPCIFERFVTRRCGVVV